MPRVSASPGPHPRDPGGRTAYPHSGLTPCLPPHLGQSEGDEQVERKGQLDLAAWVVFVIGC